MIIMSAIMLKYLYINPKAAGIEAISEDANNNIEIPDLKGFFFKAFFY